MKPTITQPGTTLARLLDVAWPQTDRVRQLTQQLQQGQLLSARVLDMPQPGLAKLELLTTELLARTRLPLQVGQQLKLEVIKQGRVPELRVLPDQARESASQQVLRHALPRQLPVSESLRELTRLLQDRQTSALPQESRQLIRQILDRPLSLQKLNHAGLQQAVRNSGLFTEALLAQGRPLPTNDHKLLLWKLLNTLFQARSEQAQGQQSQPKPSAQATNPSGQVGDAAKATAEQAKTEAQQRLPDQAFLNRLTKLVEGSLARIHTQQAVSLPQDDGGPRNVWQLELPISMKDQQTKGLQLQIEQEPETDPAREGQHRWRVKLDFDFGILGAMQASVLLEGKTVSSTFWCELEKTEHKVDIRLPELADALQKAGLSVGQLFARHGLPDHERLPRRPESLLDERV